MWILRFLGFVATWAGRFRFVSFVLGFFGAGAIVMALPPPVLGTGIIVIAVIIYFVVETAINWYPKYIASTRYINLPKQKPISFQEISNSISRKDDIPYERVLQSLIKALWFGELENDKGDSRVTMAHARATQSPHGEEPRPTNGHGNPLNPDEVPQDIVSRSRLLYAWEPVDGINVPTKQEIRESEWKDLKKRINFHRLANLPVNRYSNLYKTTYIEPLTISQKDFFRWLMRYVTGHYE